VDATGEGAGVGWTETVEDAEDARGDEVADALPRPERVEED
jgi:hypothetical protein